METHAFGFRLWANAPEGQKQFPISKDPPTAPLPVLSKEEDKIAAMEAKLRNMTEVLAEVVEELMRTKKNLGRAKRAVASSRYP
jgi:hypothetical protein